MKERFFPFKYKKLQKNIKNLDQDLNKIGFTCELE